MCRTMKESERDSQAAAAALEECACGTASDSLHEGPGSGRSAPPVRLAIAEMEVIRSRARAAETGDLMSAAVNSIRSNFMRSFTGVLEEHY